LNLPYLNALTPHHYLLKVHGENIEPFGFREADFAGITALTGSVYRAYQIVQIYLKQGIPTVMGGIHVSMMPEEALRFCDKEHNQLVARPCQYPVQFNCKTWIKCLKGTH